MAAQWENFLEKWTRAGLIDPAAAERVRAYEAGQDKARGLRWPVLVAIALGGLLLGAGVLLFVAAHWEALSPAQRFALVLVMVAGFHGAAAFTAARFAALAAVLHAVGTVCLGAGIFLAGQIFHLQEHWPGGVMLWAAGAWAAWALLRDWPQAALAAILTPAWLGGEWLVATEGMRGAQPLMAAALLMLSISYLTAITENEASPVRKALAWIGGLTLIPAAALVVTVGWGHYRSDLPLLPAYRTLGWTAAYLAPLVLSLTLRKKMAVVNIGAALWVAALSVSARWFYPYYGGPRFEWHHLLSYGLCGLGAVGLIAWGMMEARRERVNLGIAGFALTVLSFYFSSLMDKLGRSASLIGLGVLFLAGGWLLEKTRRRLLVRIEGGRK
ncbi:MAG: DUF2157 domain-containing protein [Thermodesulfobacteriota bacterium]